MPLTRLAGANTSVLAASITAPWTAAKGVHLDRLCADVFAIKPASQFQPNAPKTTHRPEWRYR